MSVLCEGFQSLQVHYTGWAIEITPPFDWHRAGGTVKVEVWAASGVSLNTVAIFILNLGQVRFCREVVNSKWRIASIIDSQNMLIAVINFSVNDT